MPPESVPELLKTWLLAICRSWFHAWTKMPPPPCELLRIPRPSMLDGLQKKLLGNGFDAVAVLAPQPRVAFVVPLRSNVPAGNVSATNGLEGKVTPLPSSVMAAPSSAPISVGSCSNWARLPLRVASHPTTASSGMRSICGLTAVALKPNQPVPQPEVQVLGVPLRPRPKRQLTWARQEFSFPAGWVFPSMMLDAAPTPCRRRGFHTRSSS